MQVSSEIKSKKNKYKLIETSLLGYGEETWLLKKTHWFMLVATLELEVVLHLSDPSVEQMAHAKMKN